MTITLGWWAIPAAMALTGFGLWWHGSRESGMFGGIVQFLFGAGLIAGAIGALIVGMVK